MATQSPPTSTLASPPHFFVPLHMEPASMQAMVEHMPKAQEDRLVCLCGTFIRFTI